MANKHAAECSKAVCYDCKFICVRCRICSTNKIAKSIGVLDKIAVFCLYMLILLQLRAFVIGVPLSSPVGKYSFVHLQFTTVNGNMLSFQSISVSVF